MVLAPNQWFFFALSHSSTVGVGQIVVLTSNGKAQTTFNSLYEYQLHQKVSLSLGAISIGSSPTDGFIGNFQQIYILNNYFSDADLLWSSNYFLDPANTTYSQLLANNMIWIEYIFDDSTGGGVSNRVNGTIHSETLGLKEYISNQGLNLANTVVSLKGDLLPIATSSTSVNGLSFVFTAVYSGFFTSDVMLFERGSNGNLNSIQILLTTGYNIRVNVGLNNGGKVDKKSFTTSNYIFPGQSTIVYVVVATGGPGNFVQIAVQINGATEKSFNPMSGSAFDWTANKNTNNLGSQQGTSQGASVITSSFRILEGGGGLLFSQQNDPVVGKL